jgi:anti-sigma factor RsiW
MRLPLYRPHSRYLEMADAFADGELSKREHSRFEGHLATCEACGTAVETARETKRLLAALPEVDAPRSFRLTPAMVGEAAPRRPLPVPSRVPVLVLRASQATAGLAAAALAVVVSVNLSSSTGNDDDVAPADALGQEKAGQPGASDFAVTQSSGAGANGAATPAATQPAASAAATAPPAPNTGADGQSTVDDEGARNLDGTAKDEFASPTVGPGEQYYSESTTGGDVRSVASPEVALTVNVALDERSTGSGFPTLEVVLAGIVVGAAGVAVGASRMRKEQR